MMEILASKSGTPGATRTPDTRFRKPLLYPPELQGQSLLVELGYQ